MHSLVRKGRANCKLSAMVVLDGERLTIAEVKQVANAGARVEIASHARERMARSRKSVSDLADSESPIYAVNTGVGLLANRRLTPAELEQLQDRKSTRLNSSHLG